MNRALNISRRSVLAGLVAGAAGLVLSGCSSDADFDEVKSLALRLGVGTVGHEIIRDYHGRRNPIEGDHPTLMLLMSGDARVIEAPTIEALKNNKFTKDSETDYWTRMPPNETSTLGITVLQAGESFYFPQHEIRVTVKSESVLYILVINS